jgi:hypothetical protein
VSKRKLSKSSKKIYKGNVRLRSISVIMILKSCRLTKWNPNFVSKYKTKIKIKNNKNKNLHNKNNSNKRAIKKCKTQKHFPQVKLNLVIITNIVSNMSSNCV